MVRLSVTFALACASAIFFLLLRCQGKGTPFGRHSRRWALLVVVATGFLSTVAAFGGLAIVQQLPGAFVGLGIVGPSGLWLSEIHSRREEPRSPLRDMSTLWLSRLLARLNEGMAEDRAAWCEKHVDETWTADELSRAARFYQEYMRERMTPAERRRGRIYAQVSAIEARLTAVAMIENGETRPKIAAALQVSRTTKDSRYSRNMSDLQRMADVLHHDAERDLVRLLGSAYSAGLYRIPVFEPPRRTYSGIGAELVTGTGPAGAGSKSSGTKSSGSKSSGSNGSAGSQSKAGSGGSTSRGSAQTRS
jgi:uncharacterized membrane protein YgcG